MHDNQNVEDLLGRETLADKPDFVYLRGKDRAISFSGDMRGGKTPCRVA